MSISTPVHSANMPGQIDFAFGKDGVVQINVPGASSSRVVSVINGPDDTLYVCGSADFASHTPQFFITALNSAGDAISGFGDNGYVIDVFKTNRASHARQLVLTGNKLLLIGTVSGGPQPALARFDLQGKFDPAFGENGSGKIVISLPAPPGALSDQNRPDAFQADSTSSGGTLEGAASILDDGKILLTHYFVTDRPTYGLIIRTHANGSLDTGFANAGYLAVIVPGYEEDQTQIQSVIVDSEGRYVACGSVRRVGLTRVDTFFARYSPEGQSDTSFAKKGFEIIESHIELPGGARAVAIIPLEGGGILSVGGSQRAPYLGQLVMLEENGQMSPDFNLGQPLNTQLGESSTLWKAFTRQTNEKLVVAGAIDKQMDSGNFDVVVARFDKTGKLDTEFNNGLGWTRTRLGSKTAWAATVLLQAGKIVVGGVSDDMASGVVLRYHG